MSQCTWPITGFLILLCYGQSDEATQKEIQESLRNTRFIIILTGLIDSHSMLFRALQSSQEAEDSKQEGEGLGQSLY